MLYFLITWNLLAIVCWITGINLLGLLQARCFDRFGDRLITSIWSGTVLLSIALLAVSFVLPLSPLVGLGIVSFFAGAALLTSQGRAEITRLKAAYSIQWLTGVLGLEFLTAALVNRPMEWFDSGGYHIGAIRWLAEVGAVPGLALMNYAFGFTSSWFAFTAPLAPAILGRHLGAVTNGFVFLLAAIQVLISLSRWQRGDFRVSDGFVAIVHFVIIATYTVTIFTGSPILVSFSPDVPVTMLIGIIAWVLLVIEQSNASDRSTWMRRIKLLPLILGIGAISLKLSAMPAFAIVALFYAFEVRFALKKLLVSLFLVVVLSAPMLGYGLITSGCPFFPSTAICVDLPWRFPDERASYFLRESKVLNLEESAPSDLTSAIAQRLMWLRTQPKMQMMLLCYGMSIAISFWWLVLLMKRKLEPGSLWVMGIGVLGMTFVIFYAPLIRFGLIYFIVIPALFLAQILSRQLNAFLNRFRLSPWLHRSAIAVTCVFVIILSQDWRSLLTVVPPALPKPKLIQAQFNDIEYVYPADWTYKCWATSLPCAGGPIQQVRLRDPHRGIRAGFVAAE